MKLLKLVLVVCGTSVLFTLACSTPSNSNQTAVITNSNTAPAATNANLGTSPAVQANTNAAVANSNAAATGAGEDFTQTRALYTQHCAMCHGANGEGQKMGQMNIPSLKTGEAIAHSDAELNNYITNGEAKEGMPAFKNKLSKEQIAAMVRYIRQEFQAGKATNGTGPAKPSS